MGCTITTSQGNHFLKKSNDKAIENSLRSKISLGSSGGLHLLLQQEHIRQKFRNFILLDWTPVNCNNIANCIYDVRSTALNCFDFWVDARDFYRIKKCSFRSYRAAFLFEKYLMHGAAKKIPISINITDDCITSLFNGEQSAIKGKSEDKDAPNRQKSCQMSQCSSLPFTGYSLVPVEVESDVFFAAETVALDFLVAEVLPHFDIFMSQQTKSPSFTKTKFGKTKENHVQPTLMPSTDVVGIASNDDHSSSADKVSRKRSLIVGADSFKVMVRIITDAEFCSAFREHLRSSGSNSKAVNALLAFDETNYINERMNSLIAHDPEGKIKQHNDEHSEGEEDNLSALNVSQTEALKGFLLSLINRWYDAYISLGAAYRIPLSSLSFGDLMKQLTSSDVYILCQAFEPIRHEIVSYLAKFHLASFLSSVHFENLIRSGRRSILMLAYRMQPILPAHISSAGYLSSADSIGTFSKLAGIDQPTEQSSKYRHKSCLSFKSAESGLVDLIEERRKSYSGLPVHLPQLLPLKNVKNRAEKSSKMQRRTSLNTDHSIVEIAPVNKISQQQKMVQSYSPFSTVYQGILKRIVSPMLNCPDLFQNDSGHESDDFSTRGQDVGTDSNCDDQEEAISLNANPVDLKQMLNFIGSGYDGLFGRYLNLHRKLPYLKFYLSIIHFAYGDFQHDLERIRECSLLYECYLLHNSEAAVPLLPVTIKRAIVNQLFRAPTTIFDEAAVWTSNFLCVNYWVDFRFEVNCAIPINPGFKDTDAGESYENKQLLSIELNSNRKAVHSHGSNVSKDPSKNTSRKYSNYPVRTSHTFAEDDSRRSLLLRDSHDGVNIDGDDVSNIVSFACRAAQRFPPLDENDIFIEETCDTNPAPKYSVTSVPQQKYDFDSSPTAESTCKNRNKETYGFGILRRATFRRKIQPVATASTSSCDGISRFLREPRTGDGYLKVETLQNTLAGFTLPEYSITAGSESHHCQRDTKDTSLKDFNSNRGTLKCSEEQLTDNSSLGSPRPKPINLETSLFQRLKAQIILEHCRCCSIFKEYLDKEGGLSQTLLYFVEAQEYQRIPNADFQLSRARKIFNKYLHDLAPMPVPVSSHTRAEIGSAVADGLASPSLFSVACWEVLQYVELIQFPRFLHSVDVQKVVNILALEELADSTGKKRGFSLLSMITMRKHNEDSSSGTEIQRRSSISFQSLELNGSFTLNKLLSHQICTRYFKDFCTRTFCAENVLFWLDTANYAQLPGSDYMRRVACKIYKKYIADEAKLQVNVSYNVKDDIFKHLLSADRKLFKKAQDDVFNLMKRDTLPKFCASSDYQQMCAAFKLDQHTSSGM